MIPTVVEQLASGELTEPQFAAHIAAAGIPLVERISDTEVVATFVHHGAEGEVDLLDLVGHHPPEPRRLRRIGETPWRSLSMVLRSDLRFSYAFDLLPVDAAPGERGQMVADPLNPPPSTSDPRLAASIAQMPDAPPVAWQPDPTAPAPSITEFSFHSTILDNDRTIWVSTPPGWSADAEPFPYVIVFDGTPGHVAPQIRDAMVRSGRVRPCVVILVDQLELRAQELPCNPDFSQMLATELVPHLSPQFNLSRDPQDAAVSGSSFGGVCAGWTALHHADTFATAIMQSPSCWYVSPADGGGTTAPDEALRHRPLTPSLIKAFRDTATQPVRIFHEVGAIEWAPPMAKLRGPFGNRWLHDVLTLKGYDTVYREQPGGHDALWWRATWADALAWAFPA